MVEYALMLAIIAGIGWAIYANGQMADSINKVFHSAGSLISNAGSSSLSKPQTIAEMLRDAFMNHTAIAMNGSNDSFDNLLTDGKAYYSGTPEGDAIAKALNLPLAEGDAYAIRRWGNDYTVIVYSAAQNGGKSISSYTGTTYNTKSDLRNAQTVPVDYYSYDATTGRFDSEFNGYYYQGDGTKAPAYVIKGSTGNNTIMAWQ